MYFHFDHNNINVKDLDASIAFYEQALDFHVVRRKEADDGSFIIVFMGDGATDHKLELTWLRDGYPDGYDLGDDEFHLAVKTDDLAGAHRRHEAMGCICFENPKMGIYFIHDPDDYWTEIVPDRGA